MPPPLRARGNGEDVPFYEVGNDATGAAVTPRRFLANSGNVAGLAALGVPRRLLHQFGTPLNVNPGHFGLGGE